MPDHYIPDMEKGDGGKKERRRTGREKNCIMRFTAGGQFHCMNLITVVAQRVRDTLHP